MAAVGRGLDEAAVERLLRMRTDAEEGAEADACAGLEEVALVLCGQADEAELSAAAAHLQECAGCARAVLEIHSLQAQGLLEVDRAPAPAAPVAAEREARAPLFGWPRLVPLAAAAVLVGGILLAWPVGGPEDAGPDLTPKGGSDELIVAVQRGEDRFFASPGDRLLEGDRLGLLYSAVAAGHLAVFSLDPQADSVLLFPVAGRESAAVRAGSEQPLPAGALVEAGSGCEWLVAVFSDGPLDTREVGEVLSGSVRPDVGCDLRVDVPSARTVRVFPVRR